jgi:hypothetical protein
MKLIINSIIMRLLGASSVDAIMAGFTTTIHKLEELAYHELAVSDAFDAKAAELKRKSREAAARADEAAERSLAATTKAQRIKELIGE